MPRLFFLALQVNRAVLPPGNLRIIYLKPLFQVAMVVCVGLQKCRKQMSLEGVRVTARTLQKTISKNQGAAAFTYSAGCTSDANPATYSTETNFYRPQIVE